MKLKRFHFFAGVLLLALSSAYPRECTLEPDSSAPIPESTGKERPCRIKGYIKYLQTTSFPGNADDIITDNLLHHRLNFRWDIISSLRAAVEIRNRIHWGETVKLAGSLNQNFGEMMDNNDIYDMSILIIDRKAIVWHAMLDRAYLRFSKKWLEMTAGRQRINWGVTLIWNPNDVFNAYSFYDFDYEERPGSDAVRLTFYPNAKSSVEAASKLAREKNQVVSAALYKWNRAKYDFQVLAGVVHEDVAAGGGWAGNIKNAGFKGEFTYFRPYDNALDTTGVFAGTLSFDYSFKKNFYLNGSFLYTSNGSSHADFSLIENLHPNAKTLSPYKYNFLVQVLYPFTPIITGSLAVLYSPGGDNALFIYPVLTYNILENWDMDVTAQIFLTSYSGKYQDVAELLFLRLRWNY
ncbi:MAG TPA: hypothetical protein VNJ07_04120 [Chitinophagales bacterium]|nr:hypothetical protein [Chitinophagales bacterium]